MATNSSRLDRIKGLAIPPDSDSEVDPELLELLREIQANATGDERGAIIQGLNPDGCYIKLLEKSGVILPPTNDNPGMRRIRVEALEPILRNIIQGKRVETTSFITIDNKEVYMDGGTYHPMLFSCYG